MVSLLPLITITRLVYFVSGESVTTFPTPIEELERIQKSCETRGIRGVQEAKETHRQCLLDSNIGIEDEGIGGGGVGTLGKVNCDHQAGRNSCWKPIIQKIEACIPGRGVTVERIYAQFMETICRDEEELQRLRVSSKLCPVQSTISKSCRDHAHMTSPDLCTSFISQKRCEESDLASCNHRDHKELIQRQFKEIGQALGCKSDQDAAGVVKSSASKFVAVPFILLLAKLVI